MPIPPPAKKGKKEDNTPKDDVAGKEAARLKGTWKTVTGEIDGQPLSPPEKQTNWVITGDKITWEGARGNAQTVWTFKVDPKKKPTEIELQTGRQILKGIYELDGNTLLVCLGKDRPSEFKTSAGSKHTLVVLKRQEEPGDEKEPGKGKEQGRAELGTTSSSRTP
jgi:uncharacterized protein (TIGR03067 family)